MGKKHNLSKGALVVGDSHKAPSGGIKTTVVNTGEEVLIEGGEVILNKKNMNLDKEITVTGTPKEIASAINSLDGNGVTFASGATLVDHSTGEVKKMDKGGEINNLDNSKKINTFTKNSRYAKENKKHTNRVEETRLDNEGAEISITEKAIELRRRIQEAQLDAEKRASLHVDINRLIYDYCVSENIWFDNTDKLGNFLCKGNENDVFLNHEKTIVYKINNLMNVGSVLALFDKIDYHNEFFPETKYTFTGFFGHIFGKSIALSPIFSQQYIPDSNYATVLEIDEYMLKQGFTKTSDFSYEKEDVKTYDVRPRNVLIQEDSSVYVIDAEFKEVMQEGGIIPTEKHIYLGKEGGSAISGQGMFEKAVSMDKKGIDSEIIRKETGWFKNKFDNLWRYEISDEDVVVYDDVADQYLNQSISEPENERVLCTLKDVYFNEDLFKAYPKIKDIYIQFVCKKEMENAACCTTFWKNKHIIYLKINSYDFRRRFSDNERNGRTSIKNILTHELQHVVQVREGLSSGSSLSREFEKLLEKRENGLLQQREGEGISKKDAEDICFLNDLAEHNLLNSLGEIEARDSDIRTYFDKKTRIEIPPYTLISFNDNDVIVDLEDKIEFKDGGEIPLLAPNGKPSNLNHEQWHLVRSESFKNWFGNWLTDPENSSKVIDENGEPLVVWHGTMDGRFSVFDKSKFGERTKNENSIAFFFSPSRWYAEAYSKSDNNKKIEQYIELFNEVPKAIEPMPFAEEKACFLRCINPKYVDSQTKSVIEQAILEGYDSIILKYKDRDEIFEIGVFEPNQIKLADGTNTTFDTNSDDIRYENGGEIPTSNKKELEKMEEKIDTSIQTNAFIETEIDNEPTLFDSVNSVQKFEYGGSITDIGNWNDVPNEWRNIGKISKSNFTPKPIDKGFQSFIKPYLGVDEINPRFLGVNYDDKNIVATNGHILIVMPNTTDLKGILSTRDLKNSYKIGEAIDQQYVNYEAVIPVKAPYSYKIDCYKLYQFIGAAMNYANQTTNQVVLKYDSDKHIGFNGKLLSAALKSCIQLGYESIYIHLDSPNRAALLTPKKEYEPTNVEEFLILVMPVLVSDEMIGFSGINIDYNRSLMVNFQLDKNEIVNADGSIAEFRMDYGKGELFNEKDVDLLNKIRPKKAMLPILENIAVRNGELMATDLNAIITIKQDKAKDGIYGVLNGVPYIDQSIDLDEFPINLTDGKKKIFDVDTQFFKWIVGKTLNYMSLDELRPAMTGFNLKKTTYGDGFRVTIGATDAHILLRYDITDYLTNVDSEDFDVIIRPKHLYALCDYSDKETLEVSLSQKEKRAYFTDGKATLEMRLIDERYPNIEQVIPYECKNVFELSTIDVKDIVSSKVIKDFKKNPSSYNSSGVSVYGELNDEDKVIVYAVETESERSGYRSGYRSAQKVVRKEKIGEYDISYNADVQEETDINLSLIMPVMVEEGISGNVIFSFNPKFLEEVTSGVKSSNIKFGYTETNRAYIIQGDALKYVPLVSKSMKKTASKPAIETTVEDLPIIEPIVEHINPETTQPSLSEEIENLKELLSYSEGDIKQALLEEIEGLEEMMKYDLGEGEEKETIDIGNNFSIVVEKVYYTDGNSTYGCSLNYEGKLFKYFAFVSNQTKKDAVQNVYDYLKSLSSGEVFKDHPTKGQSLVFYKDRGNSEIIRVFEGSNSFKEATQFVNDIKSISSKTFVKGEEGKSAATNLNEGEAFLALVDLFYAVRNKESDRYKEIADKLDGLNVGFKIQNKVSFEASETRDKLLHADDVLKIVRGIVNDIPKMEQGGEINKKGDGSKKKDHLVINSKDKIIFEGTEKECNKFCDTYLQDYCRVVNYWDLSNEKEYYYEQGGEVSNESEEDAIMREQFGNKQF